MRKVWLLDVNVLLGWLWPKHETHKAASTWMDNHRNEPWATCPITEIGFLRIVTNRTESEEVVQDTFLEVWRRAAEYDPRRGSPIAWIVTIGRTRAIDRLRARGAQERMLAQADAAPTSARSPAELTEGREARERVQAALAELPAEQRRVLELAYFEGLSQSEIAKKTGDALGTVKTRVRLGMEKLSATLAELWRVEYWKGDTIGLGWRRGR